MYLLEVPRLCPYIQGIFENGRYPIKVVLRDLA